MADHLRRQIREAVATAVTGLTTTNTRVFQSRVWPAGDAELPALFVYARSETATPVTVHSPREYERNLLIDVVGVAKASADLDDTLDQIAKEVEIALTNPVSALAGKATEITLQSTDIEMEQGERTTGRITLTYQVDYFNIENAPDVAH